MTTRVAGESIEVRGAPGGDSLGDGGAPRAFLWRGRLHRVSRVVDRWQEDCRGEVWRVCASSGRGADEVFDLRADREDGGAAVAWSLVAARG
ncbi:hypothetical protein GCM10009633_25260 [Janibacter melonis]|uniref:DUF6504 family protein n=1 Tax=Janibacter melonis TaxID=262209 RepID=UPI0027DFD7C7|nr:DUF6504 family protein [Janibacter melonis]MCB5990376.1 DUF6504 family protein [Janibacter melonis]